MEQANGNGKREAAQPPKIVASILIELDEQGNVSVSGPVRDRVLCYGLLETAKDIVRAADENAQNMPQKRIVTLPPGTKLPDTPPKGH